jgi:outer membrane protein assembly factor BamD
MKKFLSVLLIVLVLGSCSEYQKALKTEDVAIKYNVAEKQYEKGKYNKAIRLFEMIAPAFRESHRQKKCFICSHNRIIKPSNII